MGNQQKINVTTPT